MKTSSYDVISRRGARDVWKVAYGLALSTRYYHTPMGHSETITCNARDVRKQRFSMNVKAFRKD